MIGEEVKSNRPDGVSPDNSQQSLTALSDARAISARIKTRVDLVTRLLQEERTLDRLLPELVSFPAGTLRTLGGTDCVWCPPGQFLMGSPAGEAQRDCDEVQHIVTLTQGFWLLDHEVTQAEYLEVTGSNPSQFIGDLNRPVEGVTWDDAVIYCQKLTERERAAGRITEQQAYRLPTEAEWEYAARAGTMGPRYGELDAIGWWSGNAGDRTEPVSQKAANAWGLHDTMGNVWEWCSDWYGDYPTGSVTDPRGPSSGDRRVVRGGSWFNGAKSARSADRGRLDPGVRTNNLGFRPALSSAH
jgi:formylglycine-generating enzyme required for sulfatase activity